MKKIRVLIADDEKSIAERNKKLVLTNEKIDVIGIANDGQEEYEMILDLKPDLVITDNQMPKMNGIEVIERIVGAQLDVVPMFIIVTGDTSAELWNKSIELGVLRVINKMSIMNNLLYAVEEFIYQVENKV